MSKLKLSFMLFFFAVLSVGCSQVDELRYSGDIKAAAIKEYTPREEENKIDIRAMFNDKKNNWPVPKVYSSADFEIRVIKITSGDVLEKKIAFVEMKNIVNNMTWTKKMALNDKGEWKVSMFQRAEDLALEQEYLIKLTRGGMLN